MKIAIPNKYKSFDDAKSGKGFFASRLTKALILRGCEVTHDPADKADFTIGLGKFMSRPKGLKILRVGGVHIDSNMDCKKLNKAKKAELAKADGVIFVSKWVKAAFIELVGRPKVPTTVIHNGASFIEEHENTFNYHSPYKVNFLASAHVWNRQKRLKHIIAAFIRANIPDSGLWVCGEKTPKTECANIEFLGNVDQKTLHSLYKKCCCLIDLTYLSACPNTVVEALVAGCPVICTPNGGTHELLELHHPKPGTVLNHEPMFEVIKPVDLKKPPELNVERLAEEMKYYAENKITFMISELHIEEVAQQYILFIRRLKYGHKDSG